MGGSTYANRGQALEEMIEMANRTYRERDLAVVTRVPTRIIPIRRRQADGSNVIAGAKVVQKSIVDFVGTWQGRFIAFDAKSTRQERWPFSNLEPHQEEYFRDVRDACSGGVDPFLFLLVDFAAKPDRILMIPFDVFERMDAGKARSATYDEMRQMGAMRVQNTVRAYVDWLLCIEGAIPTLTRPVGIGYSGW